MRVRRLALFALLITTLGVAAAACGRSAGAPDAILPAPGDYGNGQDQRVFVPSGLDAVNLCVPIASAHGDRVRGSFPLTTGGPADQPPFPFGPDRRVLVMQVQDVGAVSGTTSAQPVPGRAGQWQIVRILSASSAELLVDTPLPLYLSSGGRHAQACTVPELVTVSVTTNNGIVAPPWDGSAGGVVAMFVDSVLELRGGGIRAGGAGFRGGVPGPSNGDFGATELDLDPASGRAGGKGEGLDGRAWTLAGRGNLANAGGGGNAHNAGGGGGAGGGAGGRGGMENSVTPLKETAGMGGMPAVDAGIDRLLFGGGGGAGHHNNNGGALQGGAGGGAVLVFARTVRGGGFFAARGGAGGTAPGGTPAGDGASGGGGGGTIIARAEDASAFFGAFQAGGGTGGLVVGPHGPGGGGGGGRVFLEGFAADTLVVVSGGYAGFSVDDPTPRFPTAGSAGFASGF